MKWGSSISCIKKHWSESLMTTLAITIRSSKQTTQKCRAESHVALITSFNCWKQST